MPPRKSTKALPAPADTRNTQSNAAPKLTSVVLAASREEEESDTTQATNSNSSDDDDDIANAADESNSSDEDDDSDSIEEVPIAVPQKRGKASKNTATPKSFFTHISYFV
jgi:hypothetical protein